MDIINLLISLVSGAAGGTAAGAAMPEKGLGILGNALTGLVGGGASSWIMQALGILAQVATSPEGTPDFGTILGNIAASGAGGAVLTALASWIKNATASK